MSRKNKTTKSSEPLCFCVWLHKKEAIDNMKDEEAGYHLYKILKPVTYNKVG